MASLRFFIIIFIFPLGLASYFYWATKISDPSSVSILGVNREVLANLALAASSILSALMFVYLLIAKWMKSRVKNMGDMTKWFPKGHYLTNTVILYYLLSMAFALVYFSIDLPIQLVDRYYPRLALFVGFSIAALIWTNLKILFSRGPYDVFPEMFSIAN